MSEPNGVLRLAHFLARPVSPDFVVPLQESTAPAHGARKGAFTQCSSDGFIHFQEHMVPWIRATFAWFHHYTTEADADAGREMSFDDAVAASETTTWSERTLEQYFMEWSPARVSSVNVSAVVRRWCAVARLQLPLSFEGVGRKRSSVSLARIPYRVCALFSLLCVFVCFFVCACMFVRLFHSNIRDSFNGRLCATAPLPVRIFL